jgi:hypothetical protein
MKLGSPFSAAISRAGDSGGGRREGTGAAASAAAALRVSARVRFVGD